MPPSPTKSEATTAQPKPAKAAKASKAQPDATTAQTPESLNAARANEIQNLLEALAHSTDTNDKKKIRRSLRSKGHFGGLLNREVDKQRNAGRQNPSA